jgi:tRNA A-37 threonylcarbamoyl transferase component Bud32
VGPPSPTTRAAYDTEIMRAALQQYLVAPGRTAYHVRECRITNRRRRDGSSGTVQYDVRLEDPATGHAWNQIVTAVSYGGTRTRRAWKSISRSAALDTDPAKRIALPPFAYVPELDLLLQVFPHDHHMPALAQLMAGPPAKLLPGLMAEFGSGDWELTSWDAATVQYRVDKRAILRLTVGMSDRSTGRSSTREFYAKVYRDADEGRYAFRAQSDLHERTSAAGTHLVVAKPIIFADELGTLVTEAVSGTSLSKIIKRGEGSMEAVNNAARAVAEFHHLDVFAPQRPLAEEMVRLREAQDIIATARPDLADVVRGMVDAIASGLEGAPSSLIHGDLKPDHILIDGDRVALVDFDLLGAADPIIDVAHLLGFLRTPQERSRSRGEDAEDVGQVFVDRYFTCAPDSWRARLPLHHAMTSIYRAVGLSRRPGEKQKPQQRVEAVLREGQAFLEKGADGSLPSYKRRLTRSAVR